MLDQLVKMGNNAPRVFVYATGAGAGIQKKIWETPGCSSFLVGCGFPYASSLTIEHIGYAPDRFVSRDVAIELAIAAYIQAYQLGKKTIGVGLTCSVASTVEHRGEHRIIAATFSDSGCFTFSARITKGVGVDRRKLDGEIADQIGVALIIKDALELSNDEMIKLMVFPGEEIFLNGQVLNYNCGNDTENAMRLILEKPFHSSRGERFSNLVIDNSKVIRLPGSYNPLHFGHIEGSEAIRQTAAKKFGECRDILFETVADPPHKAAPTAAELVDKIAMMHGRNFCLTSGDPLFIDKARRNPGAWFGLGVDTLINMLNPKWGIDPIELLAELQKLGIKMFVLGRCVEGEFTILEDVVASKKRLLKPYLDTLLISVPGQWDVSSTEIRSKG
jgi:hypothetical protein